MDKQEIVAHSIQAATPTAIEPEQLKAIIEREKANRQLIKEYIDHALIKDVDYIKIHVSRNCQNKYDCKDEKHYSKPTLAKSGSEKFTSLFHLRPVFIKDQDTWEMAGQPHGAFFYVCQLLDGQDRVVAEGRGAATLAEKGSLNVAIKIAQKRAQTDAVLRHGALSDFFTQDLEDMQQEEPKKPIPPKPPEKTPWQLQTEAQKKKILSLCTKLSGDPLKTKEDYESFVWNATGLKLINGNFKGIIEKLEIWTETHKDTPVVDGEVVEGNV